MPFDKKAYYARRDAEIDRMVNVVQRTCKLAQRDREGAALSIPGFPDTSQPLAPDPRVDALCRLIQRDLEQTKRDIMGARQPVPTGILAARQAGMRTLLQDPFAAVAKVLLDRWTASKDDRFCVELREGSFLGERHRWFTIPAADGRGEYIIDPAPRGFGFWGISPADMAIWVPGNDWQRFYGVDGRPEPEVFGPDLSAALGQMAIWLWSRWEPEERQEITLVRGWCMTRPHAWFRIEGDARKMESPRTYYIIDPAPNGVCFYGTTPADLLIVPPGSRPGLAYREQGVIEDGGKAKEEEQPT